MKNAKGTKLYLAGQYNYDTTVSSYWVLSDSWSAKSEDSDFWDMNYVYVGSEMMAQ